MEYATAASLLCPTVNEYRMNLPKLGSWVNGEIDFEEEFNSYEEIKSDMKQFMEKLKCIKQVTNDIVLSYYRKAESEEIDYSDLKKHMEELIKLNQTETSTPSSFGLLFSTDNMKERSNKFAIVKKCMESCATVVMEPILIKFDGEINCNEPSTCNTTVYRFRDEDIDYAVKPSTSKKRNLGGVEEFAPICFYNFDDTRQCCSLWSSHQIEPDFESETDGTREEFYVGYAMIVTTTSSDSESVEDNKKPKLEQ